MAGKGVGVSSLAVVGGIEGLHDDALACWATDSEVADRASEDIESVILAQHRCNYELWGLEDQARRRDVPDSTIADIKRSIDRMNQKRNDLVENVDELLLAHFDAVDLSHAELHSETAGQMIDRLSILALKIRNMSALAKRPDDADLAEECAAKAAILRIQRADLADCLRRLLADFAAGVRYFKLYRQFKAYNDPRLNPALATVD